ncbi:MAG TPA: methyltransferase domain-containing protein [Fredinandcohnia sp.]|nr:methyltransferase domain-containing protein [Fredinandcohnia sp.]
MNAEATRALLPPIVFLRPIVEGARVLEIGGVGRSGGRSAEWLVQTGARAVVAVDADASAVAAARAAIPSSRIRFVQGRWEDLGAESFDLVWLHHLGEPVDFRELAARLDGGRLVLVVAAGELGGAMAYRALRERLGEVFPSVEVATQRPLVAAVLSFGGSGVQPLHADPSFEPPPEASAYLFVCGPRPSGFDGQWIVPLPPEEDAASLRRALAESEARCEALERKLAHAEARIWELEQREKEAWPNLDVEERRLEAMERKLRELREREEMAQRRALDAEERVRELERRAESWQSSRAEILASLRLSRFRAEQAQRNAEGVFDAVAERDRLVETWRQRALAAERRAEELERRRTRET